MRTLVPAAAAALLLACATARGPARPIWESDGRDLAACRFVGTFAGSSMLAGWKAREGIERAKEEAMAQAADAGATHVVWQGMGTSWGGSSAAANAYWCPPPQGYPAAQPQQQPAPAAAPTRPPAAQTM